MNLLPLESWRKEIGYNPWHFWGLADSNIVPVTSNCNDVIREYSWQGFDESGRADIRRAIETAEDILLQHLGYRVAPDYHEDTIEWPRYFDNRLYRIARMDVRGGFVPIQLNEGYVKECGVPAYEELDDAAALIYTDQDGDGLQDTFRCSAPTTSTDPSEIGVYFQSGDRLTDDSYLSERWRIQPVSISFLMGTVTIIGKKWLCVKPSLYENKSNYPIDPTVASNFITSVAIYRHYTKMDGVDSNVDSQSALIWESKPCNCGCGSVPNSSDPASEGWVAGRSGVRNSEAGIVVPAEATYTAGVWSHNCSCIESCGEPDKVLVRYLAGLPLDAKGWMQASMQTLVARLTCAEMTRRICACDQANREWSNWQFDVSRVNTPETYQAGLNVLDNPLGTRRGQIYAWQRIQELARVTGILF